MSNELRREDENISDISTWISQSEAARLRGVSREAIYNLVKKNRLKALKVGDKTLVNRIEVENYRPRLPGPKPKKKKRNEAASTQPPEFGSSTSQQRGGSISSKKSQSRNRLNKSTKQYQQSVKPGDWISQAEAARIRGVSQQAIVNLIRRGRLTIVNMAGRTVVLRSEVENFTAKLKGGRPSKQVVSKKSANDNPSKK
jgi:excisionase family DNA binding protein